MEQRAMRLSTARVDEAVSACQPATAHGRCARVGPGVRLQLFDVVIVRQDSSQPASEARGSTSIMLSRCTTSP